MTVMSDVVTDAPAVPILTLVDPDRSDRELTTDELGSRIVGLAGRLAAATCSWLLLVAEFDTRDGCARFGLASTAQWLAHHCGIAHRTAVEHVRVARSLAAYPILVEAMSTGTLSYSQVRAISRVPADGEEQRTVADLVQFAGNASSGQLETMVRGLRSVQDNELLSGADPTGADPDATQYVRCAWTARSQWRLNARLDPHRGALFQGALEAMARAEGVNPADALVRLAEVALVVLNDSGTAPRPLRGDEQAAFVIHLDATHLRTAETRPHDQAEPAEPSQGDGADPWSRDADLVNSDRPESGSPEPDVVIATKAQPVTPDTPDHAASHTASGQKSDTFQASSLQPSTSPPPAVLRTDQNRPSRPRRQRPRPRQIPPCRIRTAVPSAADARRRALRTPRLQLTHQPPSPPRPALNRQPIAVCAKRAEAAGRHTS